ncbi:MAG: DUF4255 domain-containing protein [Bacteroidota bacterium]|nr:DUF4255 domain-containing protein [Bacteroidota bacterium]
MIYEALSCLTEEMNEYFRNKLKINEEKIVLSGLVNQDGSIAIQEENKIIITLVNIEKETAQKGNGKSLSTTFGNQAPPLRLNIYVLFSAYFSSGNYPEALRFLSFIIAYFQHKTVFNQSNTPGLDPKIEKLTFEITDVNPDMLSNIWSTLGAKYMPSVLYKMRMLSFDESVIREFRPAISKMENDNYPNLN